MFLSFKTNEHRAEGLSLRTKMIRDKYGDKWNFDKYSVHKPAVLGHHEHKHTLHQNTNTIDISKQF